MNDLLLKSIYKNDQEFSACDAPKGILLFHKSLPLYPTQAGSIQSPLSITHFHENHFDINIPPVLPHGFFPWGYQTKILYIVTESFLWNGIYSLIQQSDIFIFLCY